MGPLSSGSGQLRVAGLATFLMGQLWVPLFSTAAPVSHAARLLAASETAASGWLAQQPATPTNGSGALQELIRQANGSAAKGAYGEAGRLWPQILAVVEKALGPQHPSTAASLNNLA